MKKKDNYLKVCPKCGSTNIGHHVRFASTYGSDLAYYCKKCNYGYMSNGFFPEVEESKIEEFRENLKK